MNHTVPQMGVKHQGELDAQQLGGHEVGPWFGAQ
jgi:hypothetical protein